MMDISPNKVLAAALHAMFAIKNEVFACIHTSLPSAGGLAALPRDDGHSRMISARPLRMGLHRIL